MMRLWYLEVWVYLLMLDFIQLDEFFTLVGVVILQNLLLGIGILVVVF